MSLMLLIGLLIASASSILPDEDKFEATYHGEGVNCDGTSASVEINENTILESQEGVVIAAAQAIEHAFTAIKSNPTTASVVQEALAASKKVLEVVAEAVSTVSAEINSPNPGCWAIAYGKAEAVAIAKAVSHALVTGFQEAQAWGGNMQFLGLATDIEKDVEVAIEEIALLLADGSGAGPRSQQSKVKAVARVDTLDCTLAQAFASIANDISEAEAIVEAGCFTNISFFGLMGSSTFHSSDACECVDQNSNGAPNNCKQQKKQDYICYVKDPSACACALPSQIYSNMAWRYCGETLKELQKWLSFEDGKNGIVSQDSEYGYCGELNYQDDKISQSPNPTAAAVSTLALTPSQNGGFILSP